MKQLGQTIEHPSEGLCQYLLNLEFKALQSVEGFSDEALELVPHVSQLRIIGRGKEEIDLAHPSVESFDAAVSNSFNEWLYSFLILCILHGKVETRNFAKIVQTIIKIDCEIVETMSMRILRCAYQVLCRIKKIRSVVMNTFHVLKKHFRLSLTF
jgi:hypothetical protein